MSLESNKRKLTSNITSDSVQDRIKRRRHQFNGLNIRIPKDSEIDTKLLEPFNEFFPILADEFKNIGIQSIIASFEPILDDFCELSETYRQQAPKYNRVIENFIERLTTLFNLKRTVVYLDKNSYTTSAWGNVYWHFLHLSSILVSYAYSKGLINDYLDFPLIVYNIDLILPCPMCRGHYLQIKESREIKDAIKTISFGMAMTGLVAFHNIVTANIDRTQEFMGQRKRPTFIIPDFALKYQCIELKEQPLQKSLTYIPKDVDWQSETHTYLTVLLATYCPQLYSQASCALKHIVYSNEIAFKNVNISSKSYKFAAHSATDMLIMNMSKKQIIYCLVHALLLQFQDTLISEDDMTKNTYFNNSIVHLYRKYPTIVRKLIELNLSDTGMVVSSTDTVMTSYSSRERLLAILDKLDGGNNSSNDTLAQLL